MNGRGKGEAVPFQRHLFLLHRFEQCRLRLGGRPVDLVGEQEMREHRPLAGDEAGGGRIEQRVTDDIGRHQVGSELDASGLTAEGSGQDFHQQRLAEAGNALDEHMCIGQQTDQHFVDDRLLANHRLGHFGAQRAQQLSCLLQFFCRQNRRGSIHGKALRADVRGRAGCAGHR
jgi:hypothetical protein